jgi:hypothetical protein
MYHSLSIHSSVDEHLGNSAVNVCMLLCGHMFSFLLGGELLSQVHLLAIFLTVAAVPSECQ